MQDKNHRYIPQTESPEGFTEQALRDKLREANNELSQLREENKTLKVHASNHAYACEVAKRERDKAEQEVKTLVKAIEDLLDKYPEL